jgi:hypothetical protein
VTSRIARIVALSIPLLLVCVLASTGGWRIHDGRIERVGHVSTVAAAPVTPRETPAPADPGTFVHHLSPSVPWPAGAALIVLCILPAMASTLAWSGARRRRDSSPFAAGGSP